MAAALETRATAKGGADGPLATVALAARSGEVRAAAEMLLTTAEQVSDDGGSPADYALRAHDRVGEREQNYRPRFPAKTERSTLRRLGPKLVSARETGGLTLMQHFRLCRDRL
jgi:hypothetical protein